MTQAIGPDALFLDYLAKGRFMLQRAEPSGRYVFPPRLAEPGTGAQDLRWVEASGRGTVYSTTVIRARPPEPSHNVALVTLAEGPRMMATVVGVEPDAVTIGMPVQARIADGQAGPYVVFEPVAEA